MAYASDDFTDSDGVELETHDSNWENQGTGGNESDWIIDTNHASPSSAGNLTGSYYANQTNPNKQSVECTFVSDTNGASQLGIGSRMTESTARTGYYFYGRTWTSGPERTLDEMTGGTQTELDSDSVGMTDGEVMRLECIDSSIIGYIDDTNTLSDTNSVHTGGAGGLCSINAFESTHYMDDWSITSLAGGNKLINGGLVNTGLTGQRLIG